MKHYDKGNPKPEFVIGLAGPVGTDLSAITSALDQELRGFGYHSVPIRVSDLLKAWCSTEVLRLINGATEEKRINYLMNSADILRNQAESGAALIPLVTTAIRSHRQSFLKSEGCHRDYDAVELYNHCYIINSLKHPDEIQLLRTIYGDKFLMISVNTPMETRRANLKSLIARSYKTTEEEKFGDSADALISKDRMRSGTEIGQNISGTFHLADVFIRSGDCLSSDIGRFFQIFFAHPNVTPTRNEAAMFEASAHALRSADLSRQVGAVITNRDLEIIARGCNEVPVPGGDTYWPDSDLPLEDNRDYKEGKDYNAVKKVEILQELLEFIGNKNIIKLSASQTASSIVDQLIKGAYKQTFKDLRISNLIEFGRMVHAEMFALMEAARRGFSVQDGTLYCTTFPCHMCTRHIIAAGIREVIYVEPYPKSMATELYKEEIEVDVDQDIVVQSRSSFPRKVYFQPFHGLAPQKFAPAFQMPRRKGGDGYILPWTKPTAQPKWVRLSKSHISREMALAQTVSSIPKVSDEKAVKEEA
ncbi:MAG: anti-phage dCTP deaminase [Pseudomonadota bacterium]|nr:anti-phage dCTP deaminase [Pseudomonadota bacterium]